MKIMVTIFLGIAFSFALMGDAVLLRANHDLKNELANKQTELDVQTVLLRAYERVEKAQFNYIVSK
jgi:hypothetical protein